MTGGAVIGPAELKAEQKQKEAETEGFHPRAIDALIALH